jgi:small subunit ribosomal protein S9
MAAKKKAAREDAEQPPEAAGPEQPEPEPETGQGEPVAAEQPAADADAGQGEPVAAEQPAAEEAAVATPSAEQTEPEQPLAEQPVPEQTEPEQPVAEQTTSEQPEPAAPEEVAPSTAAAEQEPAQQAPTAEAPTAERAGEGEAAEGGAEYAAPPVKPAVPGAHLEVDIVPEGVDPLGRAEEEYEDRYAIEEDDLAPVAVEEREEEREEVLTEPIASAAIDLAAGARYRATGKRKTAIARVTLRPGSGSYLVNGRTLEEHFPRLTLQRNIRQPLETVGYQERMDVVARLHGGGISAQAGALRHGVSRALLEADPNLRGELKRRGFLTRDSRAKERKKAGLKKARKRPQFSKR